MLANALHWLRSRARPCSVLARRAATVFPSETTSVAVETDLTGSGDGAAPRPGGPGTVKGMLTPDELREQVESGTIDTVVAAFTDMQGRLMGKRIQGEFF